MFPSPVGELHFSIKKQRQQDDRNGFRPLSGNCISQLWATFTYTDENMPVSVPCRGTAFLNKMEEANEERILKEVSVPCRGTAFLNTIPAIPPPVWAHGRDCVGKIFFEK